MGRETAERLTSPSPDAPGANHMSAQSLVTNCRIESSGSATLLWWRIGGALGMHCWAEAALNAPATHCPAYNLIPVVRSQSIPHTQKKVYA